MGRKMKRWNGLIKGITAFIMAAVIAMSQIPGMNFVLIAYADNDKTISGLCTGAIGNPTSGAGGWSYVYYGKYNNAAMKYRVLDINATQFGGNTMLLDCDSTLVNMAHDSQDPYEYGENGWTNSEIKAWLNGDEFLGDENDPQGAFTFQERKAIASSTKNSAAEGDGHGWEGNLGYAQLTGEHVFLLDAVEATRPSYGYKNTDVDDATRSKSGTNTWWWLRSPNSNHAAFAGSVSTAGRIQTYNVSYIYGVSPAFNLNLSSVIFSSLIPNKTNEYKLTVKDTNMTIATTYGSDVTREGNVVTVPYTITGGTPTQVSVLITDEEYSAGIVPTSGYSYQKLNVSTWGTSGTGTFTLPDEYADQTCGTDYYAYILAEDVNGDYETDYASTPVSITVPQKPILTISANDITLEYNGQTQGPGDTVYEDPAAIAKLVTVTGLLDGDTLTSITIDGQGRDVGDYELTPSQAAISNGSETVTDKYDINFVKGTLHIVPIQKNLQLGASALADNAGASGAATVYYGKNNQTWRVIGYGTTGVASTSGKLALLAGSAMGSPTKFNEYSSGQDCNNYA